MFRQAPMPLVHGSEHLDGISMTTGDLVVTGTAVVMTSKVTGCGDELVGDVAVVVADVAGVVLAVDAWVELAVDVWVDVGLVDLTVGAGVGGGVAGASVTGAGVGGAGVAGAGVA